MTSQEPHAWGPPGPPPTLPMVASTSLPSPPRARTGLPGGRLADVLRESLSRLTSRLDRMVGDLQREAAGRIDSAPGRDRLRMLAADLDGVSRTLVHIGDLLSPAGPESRWVSPRGVLESTIADLHRCGSGGPLPAITLDVAEGHAVLADPALIRRVLETLLANAIEAAGPSGEVVVTSVEYADAIEIEVADSGAGLSGIARAWLFEPGFSTKPEGDGIALAAASALVDQLGGTIDAVNCPEGGSAFTVRIPHGRRRRLAA